MNIHSIGKAWAKKIGGLVVLAFFASTAAIVYAETSKDQTGQTTTSSLPHSSDAELKEKLLGFWNSGRHDWLYKKNGMKYMVGGTWKYKWNVKNGVYFEDGAAFTILVLTDTKFVTRYNANGFTSELNRTSDQGVKAIKQYEKAWLEEH